MAEDEDPKPATSAPPQEPAAPPAEPVAPPAEPVAPPAPPNKLHEWGAAVGIMVFLALVLWVFLSFLRSASM